MDVYEPKTFESGEGEGDYGSEEGVVDTTERQTQEPSDDMAFTRGTQEALDGTSSNIPEVGFTGVGQKMHEEVLEGAVKSLYTALRARGDIPNTAISEKKFFVGRDGRPRLLLYPDRALYTVEGQPLKLSNFRDEIRQELGFIGWKHPEHQPKQAVIALNKVQDAVVEAENIEMQNLPQASQNVSQSLETLVKTLAAEQGSQTEAFSPLEVRELEAHDVRVRALRGQLVVAHSKKAGLQQEIASRRQKIDAAPNEQAREFQERKLQELLDEEALHEQVIRDLQGDMRNEIIRIKESITRFLNENTTLGERIRTLFKEQGITIASIVTALGFIISTLVLAITGGGAPAAPPTPAPSDKAGIKEWVKQRLQDLGRLLGRLAEKAAAALPGIIGGIVSWLLSTAQKAVGWLAQNLWALVVGIAGLLYLTAKDYITSLRRREGGPPAGKRLAPPKKE